MAAKKAEVKAKEPKMVSFIFKPENTAAQGHTLKLYDVIVDGLGIKTRVPLVKSLPKKVEMKIGDVITVTEDEFKILVAKGIVRSKAAMAKRQELIDNKIPLYEMGDREKTLILNERPYEI